MLYRQDRPDAALTLLDESIGLARSIGNVAAEIPFLVWASVAARATGAQDAADAYLHRSLELGAAGRFSRVYASTDVDLRDAIRALLPTLSSAARDHASALVRVPGGDALPLEDEPGSEELLTQREREVLAELVLGKSNREIGETLFITERTVKKHLANLFRKTGTSNRMALALWGRGPEI
ncbi:MAG: response regulator transcription factor [Thermomicrobiales bacterium]|nr:MAG: response regulator transcription factor [Thermomicrobiales bacterium]